MHGGVQIPMIGQQEAAKQAAMHQFVMACYMGLVPVVAARELDHLEPFGDRDISRAIADRAWDITRAVVKKVGIEVPDKGHDAG